MASVVGASVESASASGAYKFFGICGGERSPAYEVDVVAVAMFHVYQQVAGVVDSHVEPSRGGGCIAASYVGSTAAEVGCLRAACTSGERVGTFVGAECKCLVAEVGAYAAAQLLELVFCVELGVDTRGFQYRVFLAFVGGHFGNWLGSKNL